MSETLLSGSVCFALVVVVALHGWLVWREMQIEVVPAANTAPRSPIISLDPLREKLFTLRERHKRNASLRIAGRFKELASSLAVSDAWVEGAADSLGETLRKEPPEPFKPEAFFLGLTTGTARLSLKDWGVRGGSAAYTFEVSSSHRDQSPKVFRNAREGDAVGDLRLESATTRRHAGKSYQELVRVTARGKEIYRTVNLPCFETLVLSFVHTKETASRFTLEVPSFDTDRRKAELSGHTFTDTFSFDVPLGTVALRDDPNGGFRELTVGEGTVFTFAGEDYEVRNLAADHIQLRKAGSESAPERWMLRGADALLP